MKILVTGATGHVGSEVVRQLSLRNANVRVLVRKTGTAFPEGVEVAVGDLLDPISVRSAMTGVDKLYLLNAVTPDELTQGLIAYNLARKTRLTHVVYHSVFRAEPSRTCRTLRRNSRSKGRCGSSTFRSPSSDPTISFKMMRSSKTR